MAACKEEDDRKAITTVLRMLLSACGEVSEVTDEQDDGLRLSRLIDQRCREIFERRLESPINVRNFDVTSGLLAVLRECMLSHRWVAALRVLTTVVHRLPKHYGRTVLCCVLELCAQLSLPIPDSLLLALKTYAELTEYEVAFECFMSRAAAGQPLTACRAALVPLPRRRPGWVRDDSRDQLLARAYDGLASYAQYLDARRTLEDVDDLAEDGRHDTTARMTSCARDALEKWDGLVDLPGVWDVFVVKQVELLEQAGELDAAEDVLSRYARPHDDWDSVWPNAVQLLYAFHERHPQPGRDHKRTAALEQLCDLVPSHPLTLTLYRNWRDDGSDRDRVGLLFRLLDYAAWRDDVRPWRLLARELANCAEPPGAEASPQLTADVEAVDRAWSIRRDWWPAYHFNTASLPHSSSVPSEHTVSLVGFKASAAHFLLLPDNSYTQMASALADRTTVKTRGMSQLKKIVQKRSTLTLDVS